MENFKLGANKFELAGVIKSSELALVKRDEYKNGEKTGNQYVALAGNLTIKCKDSEVKLNVNVKELTGKGEVSKTFDSMKGLAVKDLRQGKDKEKVLEPTIPTLASISAKKENEDLELEEMMAMATNVRVFGQGNFQPHLSENAYVSKDMEVATNIQFDLGFGRFFMTKEPIPYAEQKAEATVEVFASSIEEEYDADKEETGRAILQGILPLYGGKAMPIKVVIPNDIEDDEDIINMAEQMMEADIEGTTLELFLDINFINKVEKVKIKADFGKSKIEEKVTRVNELVVSGARTVSEDKEFDEEAIEEAMKQRKIYHKELIDRKQNEEEGNKPKGFQPAKTSSDKKESKPRFQF